MKYLAIVLIFVSSVAFGQSTETRNLPSFSAIDVSEGILVVMTAGSKEEAVIEVTGADLEDVITEVSGQTLNIEMRGNNNYRNLEVTVLVTYKNIDEIDLSSAGRLTFETKLVSEELDIEVSSAGSMKAEIEVSRLEVDISSSGKVELSGRSDRQTVDLSSAGRYDAGDLQTNFTEIDASSAGSATVFVSQELRADANSAGSIKYKGNPEKVFSDASSGGKVRKY
ncbi:MAG: hypothetical protein ACI8QD_000247 [Cyclobacteriaceae bacterium]|jgi:hypothetical protein